MKLLAAYGSVGASSRRQVPVADNGQPGSYQLTRRVSTDKRACVTDTVSLGRKVGYSPKFSNTVVSACGIAIQRPSPIIDHP